LLAGDIIRVTRYNGRISLLSSFVASFVVSLKQRISQAK
jgi:hypothetical protein